MGFLNFITMQEDQQGFNHDRDIISPILNEGKTKYGQSVFENHSFRLDDALKHGVEKAILIFSIRTWLRKNQANKKNFIDGKYWTYNSASAFIEQYPYFTQKSIARWLKELTDQGVLFRGNFNSSKYDRTMWYSLNEPEFQTQIIPQNPQPDLESSISQNGKSKLQFEPPIPDTLSDTLKEKNKIKKENFSEKADSKKENLSPDGTVSFFSPILNQQQISEQTNKNPLFPPNDPIIFKGRYSGNTQNQITLKDPEAIKLFHNLSLISESESGMAKFEKTFTKPFSILISSNGDTYQTTLTPPEQISSLLQLAESLTAANFLYINNTPFLDGIKTYFIFCKSDKNIQHLWKQLQENYPLITL